MKKYIVLFAAAVLSFASCQKEQYGTMPGNDSAPYVTVSTFTPGSEYDADNDVVVRMAANNVSSAVYYFVELTSDKEARKLSDEAYADYVIKNGTKATLSESKLEGAQVSDVVLQGLKGSNTISVVSVSASGAKKLASTEFYGINWQNLATGVYNYSVTNIKTVIGYASADGVILQQRQDEPTTYRLKNAYGNGNHLVMTSTGIKGQDSDGNFTLMRVAPQGIGHSYGSIGAFNVRDLGAWQGDDSYNTDLSSDYAIWFYDDLNIYLTLQYYAAATGTNYGYGCDYFKVAN